MKNSSISSTGKRTSMADLGAGAAAGGGGAAAAGGGAAAAGGGAAGGGVEDVPDVRFLLGVQNINAGHRSKGWLRGNLNSPLNRQITVEEREAIFINYLKSMNFGNEELTVDYEIPDGLNRQPPRINALNGQACVLMGAMGRKRRCSFFLMIMLFGIAQAVKIAQSSNTQVPHRYRNPAQLMGDLKSLQDGIEALQGRLSDLFVLIKDAGGRPVKVPAVFAKPLALPKPLVLPKPKK